MKKILVLAVLVLGSAMCFNVDAQSRKEKKAAKAEAWRMEQEQKKEEAAILHQMKMDSIKNAQKQREEEIAAKKAAAVEAARRAEEERLNTATEDPCTIYDTPEWFAATGSLTSDQLNTLATACLLVVQDQMYQKLKGVFKQVQVEYNKILNTNVNNSADNDIENMGMRIINELINETYVVCQKKTPKNAKGEVTMYMGIKMSKESVYDKLKTELEKADEIRVRFNRDAFQQSYFNAVFGNQTTTQE